jgi:hypothetical protein
MFCGVPICGALENKMPERMSATKISSLVGRMVAGGTTSDIAKRCAERFATVLAADGTLDELALVLDAAHLIARPLPQNS